MSKHTPGPWEAYSGTGAKTLTAPRIRDTNDHFDLALIFGGLAHGQQEANAKLMAAAPELLAAHIEIFAVLNKQFPGNSKLPPWALEIAKIASAVVSKADPDFL